MSYSRRTLARSFTAAVRMGIRFVVFVCVFASFWQAPIPVLHRHCENFHLNKSAQLALHVKSLHADETAGEADWHLHFVMLDDFFRGAGLPIPPQDGDAPVLPQEHVVLGEHFQSEATSLSAPLLLAFSSDVTLAQPTAMNERGLSRLHFWEDQTTSCRLHLLLCVSRC